MTDQQLELELRAWFRADVPALEAAPSGLRELVVGIPRTTAPPLAVLRRPGSRGRLALVGLAAVLAAAIIGLQLLGWGRPQPTELPTQSPASASPFATVQSRPASVIQAAPMLEPRSGDGYGTTTWAVLLADGRVLVAGGVSDNRFGESVLGSAEIYDPATDTWSAVAPMTTPRIGHTMTVLRDRRVLVAGGTTAGPDAKVASAELFDPSTGTWTATSTLNSGRAYHTATLLADGRVLVSGGNPHFTCNGQSCEDDNRGSAEIYDPATGRWATVDPEIDQWVNMAATLLADGRVLVEGGGRLIGLQSAEIFDPATGTWRATADMLAGRNHDTAVLLGDGRVFVVGGQVKLSQADDLIPAEIYDPIAETWVATSPYSSRIGFAPATLLPNGRVLVYGPNGFMAYDPATDQWVSIGSSGPRAEEMLVRLADGRVLVAGGAGDGAASPGLTSVLIYDPGSVP